MHVVSKENVTRVVLCMDIPYVCGTRHGSDGRMHRGIWMAVEEVLKLREKRSRGCSGRAPWLSRYCILFPPLLPPYTHSLLCSSPSTALATTLFELPLPLPPFPLSSARRLFASHRRSIYSPPPAMKPVGSLSLGRKLPSAGSLLVGILVGLLVASVSCGRPARRPHADSRPCD